MDLIELDIEFLSQKVADNPASPLFARLADLFLLQDLKKEALEVCERGVEYFPSYASGFIVLSKCYLSIGEFSKARVALQRVLELSPFNQYARKLLVEIPNKPDEPQAASETEYFEPVQPSEISAETSHEATEAQPAAPSVSEPPSAQQLAETAGFEMVTEQELSFATPRETLEPPKLNTEDVFNGASQQELQYDENFVLKDTTPPAVSFPSFDEYFASQAPQKPAVTMTLDEFIGLSLNRAVPGQSDNPSALQEEMPNSVEVPPAEPDQPAAEQPSPLSEIDLLAERLKNVEKIVPDESASPEYESPETAEMDIVTPTLAEIYASQGEFGAAIQAYEILMLSHPDEQEKYQKRITELQQEQMKKEGLG